MLDFAAKKGIKPWSVPSPNLSALVLPSFLTQNAEWA